MNQVFQHEYGTLMRGNIFFGQDAVGNQFSFTGQGIATFNVETAESEIIAINFNEWLQILLKDLDYLTARKIMRKWTSSHAIEFNQRLCAKKPFVLGGEFDIANLYAQYFPTYISTNSNIPKQIHDLPDGTQAKIQVVD